EKAETARADLEYELNNGLHKEASAMSWERFREVFEEEYLTGRQKGIQECYRNALDLFEDAAKPTRLRSITERTISRFVAALRARPRRRPAGHGGTPIRSRLRLLLKALRWTADQKLIPAVPKFTTIKVSKKKPQPVPTEAFEKLLAKAPDANMRSYLLSGWLA